MELTGKFDILWAFFNVEVVEMSFPKVDFLYLNEEDMVKAGVKDMAGCIYLK